MLKAQILSGIGEDPV